MARNYTKLIRHLLTLCYIFLSANLLADNPNKENTKYVFSQSAYGGVGLIQNPSARFHSDGEFLFGISTEEPYNRVYAKVQFFPWLEAVLKYTEGTNKKYNKGISQTWKDKGIDLKVKLTDEGDYIPAIAIGIFDVGGTGSFSSEFVVANKRINNFDFSLGLGWGRYGAKGHVSNPMSILSDDFSVRGGRSALGGTLNLDRLFSGEKAAFFGGLEYSTPIQNLTFKAEYDSYDYKDEIGNGLNRIDVTKPSGPDNVFKVGSDFNYALNYRLPIGTRDVLDLSVGYVRGETIYTNFSVHSNLNNFGYEKYRAKKETLNTPYLEAFESLNDKWQDYLVDLIIWQMGNEGLVTHNVIFNDDEMIIEMSQSRFFETMKAVDLASRILANNSPKNIKTITVSNIDSGMETLRASIPREKLVESVALGPVDESLYDFRKDDINFSDSIVRSNEYLYPNFYWEIKPHLTGTLQHQIKFYFYQLEALAHFTYSIKKGLYFMGDIGIDITNNYDEYTWHVPDGELHHVRQDRRLYLTQGQSGIRRLALDYYIDLSSNLKAKVSAGLLEWMYGGVGGEIMYYPNSGNWALGFDAYWVKQRDFDQKFSFRDYETVTGHLTAYYDIPFYNLRLKTSFGKFLGKDVGALIDISRRFETGARVGGMVALTDCDSDCVGEGSFNKWIYFQLPMDLFYSKKRTTRNTAYYAWAPLTKDAGTRVEPGSLYSILSNANDSTKSKQRKNFSMRSILSGFSTAPKGR